MRSLEAFEVDPALRQLAREEIVVVGSETIGLYKAMANIPKETHHVTIDDLDGCVSPNVYDGTLYPDSCAKNAAEDHELRWVRNTYRNVETLRRSHRINGLSRPVQLDIGKTVHEWTHDEVMGDALSYDGYSVLNPLRQLAWYEMLGRKKDEEKIAKLRIIIPRLWETVAISVPAELRELASDVLKPRE